MNSLALRRDVFTSNIPGSAKTALARVLDRVGGGGSTALVRARGAIAATGDVAKEAVEAGLVGGAVGAFRAKVGPNAYIPYWNGADGTPVLSAPVEAIVAVAGFGAAMVTPHSELAPMYRRAGGVAIGILAARKMEEWLAGSAASAGVHGDFGGEKDPVAAFQQTAPRGFR